MNQVKVILYMATSVNGVIARENNEEDFLSEDNWDTLFQLANKSGCIIWGRYLRLMLSDNRPCLKVQDSLEATCRQAVKEILGR